MSRNCFEQIGSFPSAKARAGRNLGQLEAGVLALAKERGLPVNTK